MAAHYKIYCLEDPVWGRCRYIGYSKDIIKRFKKHISKSGLKPTTHKNSWIKGLQAQGINPVLKTVEDLGICDEKHAQEREVWWIKFIKESGGNLTNGTEGGDGLCGYIPSRELIERRNALLRGRVRTPEQKTIYSISKLGENNPMFGKPVSLKTRQQRSIALRGNKNGLGFKPSEEQKAKISENQTGIKHYSYGKKPFLDQYGNVFNSVKEAVVKYGLQQSNICKVLKNKRTQTGGYVFKYITSCYGAI